MISTCASSSRQSAPASRLGGQSACWPWPCPQSSAPAPSTRPHPAFQQQNLVEGDAVTSWRNCATAPASGGHPKSRFGSGGSRLAAAAAKTCCPPGAHLADPVPAEHYSSCLGGGAAHGEHRERRESRARQAGREGRRPAGPHVRQRLTGACTAADRAMACTITTPLSCGQAGSLGRLSLAR